MNVTDLSGIRPLSWTDDPKPGESLIGYVTRMFAENVRPATAQALGLAGIKTLFPESIGAAGLGYCERLAKLLGQDSEVILSMASPSIEDGPEAHSRIDFHGVELRKNYRETRLRRVSPTTLRDEPWHHAVWDIRLFDFCPQSLEILLCACPVCKRDLGWKRSRGAVFCQSCVDSSQRPRVDLREFPQERVQCEDVEALLFVTSLVSPIKEIRERNRRNVPPTLCCLSSGEIIELAVLLVLCLQKDGKPVVRRRQLLDPRRGLSPELISFVGRSLMSWPAGFDVIAERVRQEREVRPGFYGKRNELGPLAMASYGHTHVTPRMKAILDSAISRNMAMTDEDSPGILRRAEHRADDDLITKTDACREFHLGGVVLRRLADAGHISRRRSGGRKGPSLYRRSEITELLNGRSEAMPKHRVARMFGITLPDVVGLEAAGLVRRYDHPSILTLNSGTYYAKSSVEHLMAGLKSTMRTLLPDNRDLQRLRRLSSLVNERAGGEPDWAETFSRILRGELTAYYREGSKASFTASTYVGQDATGDDGIADNPAARLLKTKDVAAFLNVSIATVAHCRHLGLMGEGTKDFRFSRVEVEEFRQRFILTSEIANLTGWGTIGVAPALRAAGVEPLHVSAWSSGSGNSVLRIYSRAAVEFHLRTCPTRERGSSPLVSVEMAFQTLPSGGGQQSERVQSSD